MLERERAQLRARQSAANSKPQVHFRAEIQREQDRLGGGPEGRREQVEDQSDALAERETQARRYAQKATVAGEVAEVDPQWNLKLLAGDRDALLELQIRQQAVHTSVAPR